MSNIRHIADGSDGPDGPMAVDEHGQWAPVAGPTNQADGWGELPTAAPQDQPWQPPPAAAGPAPVQQGWGSSSQRAMDNRPSWQTRGAPTMHCRCHSRATGLNLCMRR